MTKDIYHNPENFGLEPVAEIDYSSGCYEFDYRVVWRHKETGQLYTGRDSGCSCPSPFEDYHSIDDLEPFSLSVIEAEAKKEAADPYAPTDLEITSFLEKIRSLV